MSDKGTRPPREPSKVASGGFSRGLRMTKMSVVGTARLAAYGARSLFASEESRAAQQQDLWLKQVAMWVREAGVMKGSLLKAGQMLALYGEPFLPKEAMALLRTLESEAPPVAFASIRAALVAELGQEVVDRLQIEQRPIGAASLGQVHRAIGPDGETMALKVQYPGVAAALDTDLRAIRRLLQALRVKMPKDAVDALFDEVRLVLLRELDYERERFETDRFRRALVEVSGLRVPQTFAAYSSGKVLATSFERGVSAKHASVAALSQARRNRLGLLFFDLYLRELFELGHVQTDPHLGNFRIDIAEGDALADVGEDTLVLLDFGATRAVSAGYVRTYRRMMRGCLYDEPRDILDAGLELGLVRHDDSPQAEAAFVDMCRLIAEPFSSQATPGRNDALFLPDGSYDYAASDLPQRVANRGRALAMSRGVRAPPAETLFLDRKLAGTFHFLVALGAKVDARPLLLDYLNRNQPAAEGTAPQTP